MSAGGPEPGRRARRVVIVLALAAACAGLVPILTESKPRQAASNYVPESGPVARVPAGGRACQPKEAVPTDAAQLRLLLGADGRPLPALRVTVLSAGGARATGKLDGGGRQGHVVVPIAGAGKAKGPTTVCLENFGPRPVALFGSESADPVRVRAPRALDGAGSGRGNSDRASPPRTASGRAPDLASVTARATGRVRLEWLREGRESWLELVPTLARRVGYGKANPLGGVLLYVVGLLVVGSWALAVLSLWKPPRTPYWCAAAAAVSCLAWTQLTPPFQVPDENVHFAYAQYLAETGRAPHSASAPGLSPQQTATMDALRTTAIIGRPRERAPLTEGDDAAVERAGRSPASPVGGGLTEAASQPPLYYLLQAAAYRLSPATSVVHRLAVMRLVSCLLAGLTTAFVFLFLREALPRHPWAWSVGALAAAFQPVFGFISSGVNSDALLFCAGAALFWALARGFRGGLDRRTAIAIGAALAVGVLAKLTFLALVPAALVGLGLLVARRRGEAPRAAVRAANAGSATARAQTGPRAAAARWAGLALTIAVAPVAVYVAANVLVWDRPALAASLQGVASAAGSAGEAATVGSLRQQVGYVWQLYLPRLPFMYDQFSDLPLRTIWLSGLTGSFGWLDYSFRPWVYDVSTWVAITSALLFGVGAVRMRAALSRRRQELLCHLIAVAGLLTAIGLLGIRYRATTGFIFEQARYLFPLLALYGAVIAVAAMALGRRFGPALGAAIALLALFHSLAAQLLTISRYYG